MRRLLAALIASVASVASALGGCATSAPPPPPAAPAVSEIERIQSIVARVAHHIDGKSWPALRGLYADEVDTDYTSLFGGAPQRQKGADLVGLWQKQLAAVVTQHLLGPVDVEVDPTGLRATAECHVHATHHARGEEWVVDGHYLFGLSKGDAQGGGHRWRIDKMKLLLFHESGSRKVLPDPKK